MSTESIYFTGVYAKALLSKRLQFGPLQAKRITAGNQQLELEEKIKERYVQNFYLSSALYITEVSYLILVSSGVLPQIDF